MIQSIVYTMVQPVMAVVKVTDWLSQAVSPEEDVMVAVTCADAVENKQSIINNERIILFFIVICFSWR